MTYQSKNSYILSWWCSEINLNNDSFVQMLKRTKCVFISAPGGVQRCPLYSDPHNLRRTFVCATLYFQSSLWTSSHLVPITLRWHGNLSTPVFAWWVWSLNNSEKQLWCNFSWNHKLLCSCFALCKTFKQKKKGCVSLWTLRWVSRQIFKHWEQLH